MNESARLPAGIVLRDCALTLLHRRRRLLLTMMVVLLGTVALALHIKQEYQSNSSLLVLFGPEYTFRPSAGQQLPNGNSLRYGQVLRTEVHLLGNADLYRKVIKTMGVGTLYPKLLEPAGMLSRLTTETKRCLENWLGSGARHSAADKSADIMNKAVNKFADNLAIGIDRRSAIIHVSFEHGDPEIAATALRLLEADYLARRKQLLADVQEPIVVRQERSAYAELLNADARLQAFKRQNDISNFKDRQKILLKQQGDLETELAKTESTISGLRARIAEVVGQVRVAAVQRGKGAPNAAAPLEAVVAAYRRSEVEAQTRYRGSPAVDSARTAILKSLAELGKMRATNAFKLTQDLDKSNAELSASEATATAIRAQMQSVGDQLASIDGLESKLFKLERTRAVLETNYKDVAKIAGNRQLVEAVNAQRQSSVRIIEPPNVPILPLPTRRLVLGITQQ